VIGDRGAADHKISTFTAQCKQKDAVTRRPSGTWTHDFRAWAVKAACLWPCSHCYWPKV